MREIKSEALTNDNERASCLVRTPVRRIEDEIVSVKWIKPVKKQTTISGFMYIELL